MKLVLDEIDTADQGGLLSRFVTWQQSNKMTYLQACIKEAMRIQFPAPLYDTH